MSVLDGLVVCGGQSTRMGADIDKSLLQYHHIPQREWLFELLQPLCNDVFLSCNEAQTALIEEDTYPVITDAVAYKNIGPMAALLSAFRQYPDDSLLVVGCDYPFIKQSDLQQLVKQYNNKTTVYYNEAENLYEPLLGIYTPDIYPIMLAQFELGQYSLQWVLKQTNAQKVLPARPDILQSVDTRMGYMEALVKLSQRY